MLILQYKAGTGALVQFALRHTYDDPNPTGNTGITGDAFGGSVGTTDTYAVVGAYNEDEPSFDDSGKAYIYNVNTGALLHTLDNPNDNATPELDQFGIACAISDTYTLVSSRTEGGFWGPSYGVVYCFNTVTGTYVNTINNPNVWSGIGFTPEGDQWGYSVDIDGTTMIGGAPFHEQTETGPSGAGKAYIVSPEDSIVLQTLDNPNVSGSAANDNFGFDVGIHGNRCIVGAPEEDDVASGSGTAYIFNVTNGSLVHTLDNPNLFSTATNDKFGRAVDIHGNYAIVGAPFEDDATGTNAGAAYIFNVTTGLLVHTLTNPSGFGTPASDLFGITVALNSTYALVGAHSEDEAGNTNSGKAYVFDLATGSLQATLDNPNAFGTAQDDNFGRHAAMAETVMLISASGEGDASDPLNGKAYTFNL